MGKNEKWKSVVLASPYGFVQPCLTKLYVLTHVTFFKGFLRTHV